MTHALPRLAIGAVLPSRSVQHAQRLDLATAARHAESVGLDLVAYGGIGSGPARPPDRRRARAGRAGTPPRTVAADPPALAHAAPGAPVGVADALAPVVAATERLRICAGLGASALRSLGRTARHVADLRTAAGDRLVLGVGVGTDSAAADGTVMDGAAAGGTGAGDGGPGAVADGGASGWGAGGCGGGPGGARRAGDEPWGLRADTALALLPRLLAGERVPLPDEVGPPEPAPPAGVPWPQVWVGGGSPAALRRVIRYADGWFPAHLTPDQVADGVVRLAERAVWRGRPAPTVAVALYGALGRTGSPDLRTAAAPAPARGRRRPAGGGPRRPPPPPRPGG
ncbi:LLM class flavin-dependent oxidoreductase, partial [Streptomyces sp. HSW2009]|uniref:LLM class flavin-dependent oxidoreductase n=1 Tax=Streptomyces sp. HSW2009 TaxID=3142890 RepID=UPI0032EF0DA0